MCLFISVFLSCVIAFVCPCVHVCTVYLHTHAQTHTTRLHPHAHTTHKLMCVHVHLFALTMRIDLKRKGSSLCFMYLYRTSRVTRYMAFALKMKVALVPGSEGWVPVSDNRISMRVRVCVCECM